MDLRPGMHRTPNSGRERTFELRACARQASPPTEWGAAGVVGAERHRLPQGFLELDAPKIRHILWNFLNKSIEYYNSNLCTFIN